jgi:hypothetical protein
MNVDVAVIAIHAAAAATDEIAVAVVVARRGHARVRSRVTTRALAQGPHRGALHIVLTRKGAIGIAAVAREIVTVVALLVGGEDAITAVERHTEPAITESLDHPARSTVVAIGSRCPRLAGPTRAVTPLRPVAGLAVITFSIAVAGVRTIRLAAIAGNGVTVVTLLAEHGIRHAVAAARSPARLRDADPPLLGHVDLALGPIRLAQAFVRDRRVHTGIEGRDVRR